MPLRSAQDVHPIRRRVGLIALAVSLLALLVISSSLPPTEAAATIERAVRSWIVEPGSQNSGHLNR